MCAEQLTIFLSKINFTKPSLVLLHSLYLKQKTGIFQSEFIACFFSSSLCISDWSNFRSAAMCIPVCCCTNWFRVMTTDWFYAGDDLQRSQHVPMQGRSDVADCIKYPELFCKKHPLWQVLCQWQHQHLRDPDFQYSSVTPAVESTTSQVMIFSLPSQVFLVYTWIPSVVFYFSTEVLGINIHALFLKTLASSFCLHLHLHEAPVLCSINSTMFTWVPMLCKNRRTQHQ